MAPGDQGLVEFRAGNAEACLEWTIKSRASNPKVTFGDRSYPLGTALALAAMAHHRLGHPDEARQALAEADRLLAAAAQPGRRDLGPGQENWQVWAVLLREARELIAGGASPALATSPQSPVGPPATSRAGDPDAARVGAAQVDAPQAEVAGLTGELKARPDNAADLAKARAPLLGRLGRFGESTADYELVVRLNPDDAYARFTAAIGRLHAGDVAAYRAHAGAMITRAKAGAGSGKEWAAKAYLLRPPPDGDVAAARRLVDLDLAARRAEFPDGWFGWAASTQALAEYRSGDFAACLAWVGKYRAYAPKITFGDRRYHEGLGLTLTAMAHHRLGRSEKARRALADSARLMGQCPEPGGPRRRPGEPAGVGDPDAGGPRSRVGRTRPGYLATRGVARGGSDRCRRPERQAPYVGPPRPPLGGR